MKDWEYADLRQHYKELTGDDGHSYQPGELASRIAKAKMEKIKEFKDKVEVALYNISDHYNLKMIDELRDRIIDKIMEV